MATDDFRLKVWRLHPQGCAIAPADRTLRGTANEFAARWCGPYTHANKAGWWLFPPVDIDITWKGGQEFEWELLTPYSNADGHLIRFLLMGDSNGASPETWLTDHGGRSKFTWGLVEEGVVQVWTGCIFETPPGWGLQVRSPINCADDRFHVMEAMLETDWLQQDIWLNLAFHRPGEKVELRRDAWPPLAHLMPVRRETYEGPWEHEEEMINRDSPEANRVFEYYVQFNEKKFAHGGKNQRIPNDPASKKDSTTYYRERRRVGRLG
jgi:Family of unknown function (DUF6065)